MDIEELIVIYEEGKKSGLQKIEIEFYKEVREYISRLEKEKSRHMGDYNLQKIEDQIRTARKMLKKIFEGRMIKIINIATTKAFGTEVEIKNLTLEEEKFYDALLDLLERAKKEMLEGKEITEEELEVRMDEEYILIRMLETVEDITASDGKTYKLNREDVLTLPRINAEALIKRGIAEQIRVGEKK
jgi:DNA replication factor GINS